LLSRAVPLGVACRDRLSRFYRRLLRRRRIFRITSFLPILSWLPHYDWSHSFFGDLSGGLTMAVFSVPQGIALAGITGVPPVYGLYTAIFPSFLYIFFGTSKHNALGGVQKTAMNYNATYYVNHTAECFETILDEANGTLILGNVTSLLGKVTTEMWTDGVNPVKEIHVATTIVFFAGCIQVIMGIFRLQYLTTVFSEQVMSGFVVGGGVHVFFAQIGDVLGVKLPRRSGPGYLYYRLCDLIENICNVHWPTFAISLSSFIFLIFGKELMSPWLSTAFHFPVPFDLVLVVVGITATNYAELSRRHHIKVLGNIPTEFPPTSLPRLDLIQFIGLNAAAIALTAVAIHLTVAKIVEKRYKYKINHGQELYALGFVGILSSFFPVFPVTSGFARSVVGAAVGGSTQTIWLMSMLLTVCFDMGEGLLFATGFAALTTILRMQRPKWHFIAHDSDSGTFKETKKRNLELVAGNVCIFRMDAPLIFTSIDRFTTAVWQSVKTWERSKAESFVTMEQMDTLFVNDIFEKKARAAHMETAREDRCRLVIDCSGFPYVDYLGLATLKTV
uniref:STAS domain-containing protein n=1 Tax=Angiostrongylus costaricensis TaxID=334426 RepID=A0A0R3PG86_ANGCS